MIQLTQRQDIAAQKTLLEKKVRELHRLVKGLGAASVLPGSPLPPIIRKSPKKANLLSVSPEGSPERSSLDFISTRSKPRSLNAGPSRVVSVAHQEEQVKAEAESHVDTNDETAEPETKPEVSVSGEAQRERREKDRESEARRSKRRMSRTSGEIVPLTAADILPEPASISKSSEQYRSTTVADEPDRISRRKSRYSSNLSTLPVYVQQEEPVSIYRSPVQNTLQHRSLSADNDDKENATRHRRTTAAIKLLHSSPVKSRTALNVIADPLPILTNIRPIEHSPAKPLKEVREVKSEPTSPSLDDREDSINHNPDDSSARSRRGKTVNYAEPSLRVKMRRTESLPGDKRRKSTYRRISSSSALEEARRNSNSGRTTITIDED